MSAEAAPAAPDAMPADTTTRMHACSAGDTSDAAAAPAPAATAATAAGASASASTATAAPAPTASQPQSQPQSQTAAQPQAQPNKLVTKADFEWLGLLGRGSYAEVKLVRYKQNGVQYAVKVVDKAFVQKQGKVATVMNEKKLLLELNHPSIIKLQFTFQDQHSLFFALELAPRGELYDAIARTPDKRFDMATARFFAAELIVVLEYLHSRGVIHRDLKPENLLLDATGHLKVTDFGTAKSVGAAVDAKSAPTGGAQRKRSFVGTAEYVSPEVLADGAIQDHGMDLWALGCIIFQMLTGRPAFRGESEYLTFKQIEARQIRWPGDPFPPPPQLPGDEEEDAAAGAAAGAAKAAPALVPAPAGEVALDAAAKDLIDKLLQLDPTKRLGYGGGAAWAELKSHPFFHGLDFATLRTAPAPQLPEGNPIKKTEQQLDEDKAQKKEAETAPAKTQEKPKEPENPDVSAADREKWSVFLLDGERIVYTGVIGKRGKVGDALNVSTPKEQRQLILTAHPRFVYVNPEGMQLRGEIMWSAGVCAELKGDGLFYIRTAKRNYLMASKDARKWVEHINAARQLFKPKHNSS